MFTRRNLLGRLPAAAAAQTTPYHLDKKHWLRGHGAPAVGIAHWGSNAVGRRAWAVTYNSQRQATGSGLGLYHIEQTLEKARVHVHDGTHANRLIHRNRTSASSDSA
jgi:hypothetical protein